MDRRRGGARRGRRRARRACGRRSWSSARSRVDREEGLGAVELCLVARALGTHLASVPYLGSAALRYAVEPSRPTACPPRSATSATTRVAVALLEPGRGWSADGVATAVGLAGLDGRKVAVEHAGEVDRFAVVAIGGRRAGARARRRGRVERRRRAAAVARPELAAARRHVRRRRAPTRWSRAISARRARPADRGRRAAGRRRVRRRRGPAARRRARVRRASAASSAARSAATRRCATSSPTCTSARPARWSTVLYAAAALDDDLPDAMQTAAVAKAYVARAAREVAHGALQVFGGIAFTAGAPGASLPAADRRPRAAVRRRRAPRARARPALAATRRAPTRRSRPPSADEGNRHDLDPEQASTTRPPSALSASAPAPTRTSSARCSRTSCTTRAG